VIYGSNDKTTLDFHAETVPAYCDAVGYNDCTVLSSGPATVGCHGSDLPIELPRLALGKPKAVPADFSQSKDKTPADLDAGARGDPMCGSPQAWSRGDIWLSPLPVPVGDAPATMRGDVPDLPAFTRTRTMDCSLDSEKAPFVEMIFDAQGEERSVQIFRRPLGAEFSKRSHRPTKVSKVDDHSYAWHLGMEPGWAVKSVCGEDVTNQSFAQAQELIKSALLSLPVRSA